VRLRASLQPGGQSKELIKMENAFFLFAAYSIVWLAVFGYIFYLHKKQEKLWQKIDVLEEKVDKDLPD
jgi:CcmD family protein